MQRIVECVPNFSEGRRPEVYQAIASEITNVAGIQMLGVSADKDHNRTVITFAGQPQQVEEAAYLAIKKAAELINLDEHLGEHPRLGATDVCPFIPVKGVTMAECVEMAQRVGERVGDLGIAVYLYGEAATHPDRKLLSKIRRGQYEQWKAEVTTNPDRTPDFGPAEPQPWGAATIGARPFLIAYNLYLNSSDVEIAKKIGKAVRFSSGGLRFVQGMGFLVDGQAQVSMNLTNFEKTPIHRVQEMVKREAAQYGLTVTKAELVGLIPQQALLDSAKYYLQLDEMQDDQILENRLAAKEPSTFDAPRPFVEAVAQNKPTPGGGSVAALTGALAAALAQMMAGLTVGRKNYAAVSAEAQLVFDEAAMLQQRLSTAISADAAAFDGVMAAFRNKKLDKAARGKAIEAATVHAGEVPLQVMQDCLAVAKLSQKIVAVGNKNAVTDGASAAVLARAAAQVASMNVKINATTLQDKSLAQQWLEQVTAIENEIGEVAETVMVAAAERGGFG